MGIQAGNGNRILIAVVGIVGVLGSMDRKDPGAIRGGAIFQSPLPHARRDRGDGRDLIAEIAGKIPHEVAAQGKAAGVYPGGVCCVVSHK